jgi:DNA-binding MarR family transcriptional regulator
MPRSATARAARTDDQSSGVEDASLALVEMTLAALAAVPGVSVLQMRVLLVIDRHGPLNLSSLAERLDLSVPSASRLVDRLVEAEMVTRAVSPRSRREVSLTLTTRGRRALSQLRRSRQEAIRRVLDEMSADDRAALTAGLAAFSSAFDH